MNAKPTLKAELVAEFLGTFILMLFGIGVVAMVVLFPSKNPGETIHGGFTNITLGWGLAVTNSSSSSRMKRARMPSCAS